MNYPKNIVLLSGCLPPYGNASDSNTLRKQLPGIDEYLAHFGFDQLAGKYARYNLGSVNSGEYCVAVHHWVLDVPKATILLVHGLFDHTALYLPLVGVLLDAGYDVLAIDFPEHGLSSGTYGHVDNFDVYAQSVRDVLSEIPTALGVPIYAAGQSTGGAVLMNYIQDEISSRKIERLILLAPLLRVSGWTRIRISYFCLRYLLRRVPRNFTRNSHDQVFLTFLKDHDPFQPRYISVKWIGAMLNWAGRYPLLAQCNVPGVVIQGEDDGTVDAAYNVPNILKKFPNLEVCRIEHGMHHLIREEQSIQKHVFTAVLNALK